MQLFHIPSYFLYFSSKHHHIQYENIHVINQQSSHCISDSIPSVPFRPFLIFLDQSSSGDATEILPQFQIWNYNTYTSHVKYVCSYNIISTQAHHNSQHISHHTADGYFAALSGDCWLRFRWLLLGLQFDGLYWR